MDKLSPQQRHNNMAAIHSKDTKPEMVVRKRAVEDGIQIQVKLSEIARASGSGDEEV